MTTARALESRINAWRSFRGIARAARNLAAAQSLQWSAHVQVTGEHLAWTRTLASYMGAPRGPDQRHVVLAFGTELGLCGRLNPAVAERTSRMEGVDLVLAIGSRLTDVLSVPAPTVALRAPASLAAVETLGESISTLLGTFSNARASIVLTAGTTASGGPIVEVWDSHDPQLDAGVALASAFASPIQDLTPPDRAQERVADLLLRARIAHAAAVATASESAARLFVMTRAHDASDRSLAQQELQLQKLRNELITQDMLEVRRPRSDRRTPGHP